MIQFVSLEKAKIRIRIQKEYLKLTDRRTEAAMPNEMENSSASFRAMVTRSKESAAEFRAASDQ
jgi:hypothetical protein